MSIHIGGRTDVYKIYFQLLSLITVTMKIVVAVEILTTVKINRRIFAVSKFHLSWHGVGKSLTPRVI